MNTIRLVLLLTVVLSLFGTTGMAMTADEIIDQANQVAYYAGKMAGRRSR